MPATKSKYAAVLPGLPKAETETPERQQKIDALKATMPTHSVSLATIYAEFDAEKEQLKAELSDLQLRIDAVQQLLVESQEAGAEGWGLYGVADNALRLPDGSTLRVQAEPVIKVVDKEAYRLWCVANGYERQLQLWPSTTAAIGKERLVNGEEPPAGTEAGRWSKIVYTAAKKGEQ